ncbi:IS1 family transposase [Sphingomonas jejuensis]|uniref:IS1 family transposase n=1 Tax=Sphingomonas jejuensis TaxID=904715 RepID=A0ABX0XHV2_9SPHN|nr:hypothetical protein [Sphingomonas jejuensis]NJC32894.1 IS1 family transposase [Sphingomonas jejuensis]
MMDQLNSHIYYRRREQHEKRMAERSSAPEIAAIHTDMAKRYARLYEEALRQEASLKPRILL